MTVFTEADELKFLEAEAAYEKLSAEQGLVDEYHELKAARAAHQEHTAAMANSAVFEQEALKFTTPLKIQRDDLVDLIREAAQKIERAGLLYRRYLANYELARRASKNAFSWKLKAQGSDDLWQSGGLAEDFISARVEKLSDGLQSDLEMATLRVITG